jgi:hypothetical protein
MIKSFSLVCLLEVCYLMLNCNICPLKLMPTTNNPKRQKGGGEEEENSIPSTTPSAVRAEEDDEDTIITTTQRINRTFDEAKENTRRAVQEAERELPRYMQIVTTNQEQSVGAVRDTIESYLDSQREVTNFIQSFWKSYIDNVVWMPTRRAIENYATAVSNTTDATVAAIRIYNNIIYANAEAVRLSLEYNRDNAKEMSRVFVNTAKQLEKI